MFKIILSFFISLIFISCSDSAPSKLISSYKISVDSTTLPLNQTTQLNVIATYDDGSTTDVTSEMDYSSEDSSVATIDSLGMITTYSKSAKVDIYVNSKDKLTNGESVYSDSISLDIKKLILESIDIKQDDIKIAIGDSYQLTATGYYQDGVSLDITNSCGWKSVNSDIATVEKGLVKGVDIGDTYITAYQDDIVSEGVLASISKPLYTSILIEADKTELYVEQNTTLILKGVEDDNSSIVLSNDTALWSSSDTKVLDVDENGTVTALSKGEVTITAQMISNEDYTASIDINVTKDMYVRLYKDGVEVEFPYVNIDEYTDDIPEELPEFTLVAVGANFSIENLMVTDINGQLLGYNVAHFDGIDNETMIYTDKNVSFTLVHDNSQEALNYLFNINDDAKTLFSAKFLKVEP